MTVENKDTSLYAVIMAGGSGTRFWPRSREGRPKQLLDIAGSPRRSLLRNILHLIKPLVSSDRTKIVTTRRLTNAIKKTVPEVPEENIISEPFGKNTAPAIGLSSMLVEKENPKAIMVILPADHCIKDERKFRRCIEAGVRQASRTHSIITIGITPGFPETGYGYIEAGEPADSDKCIYSVKSFHEKPDEKKAGEFLQKGNFFWNSGIFIAKASSMLREIEEHLPEHYSFLMNIRPHLGGENEPEVIRDIYNEIEPVSIDYGVIEKSKHIYMVRGDFGWNDLGSWASAAQYWQSDRENNCSRGELINLDSSGCIVYSPRKPVALLGVEDLIVVEEEDVLLVCKKQRSQDVKKLVDAMRSKGKDHLL